MSESEQAAVIGNYVSTVLRAVGGAAASRTTIDIAVPFYSQIPQSTGPWDDNRKVAMMVIARILQEAAATQLEPTYSG